MSVQPRPPRTSRRWVVGGLAAAALVVGLAVLGAWCVFAPSLPWGPDMSGLQGVWREDNNPKHSYAFRKDGTLLWKTSMLVFGDLMFIEAGTWKRDGRRITVLPDRNWKVEGELQDDGTIRGKMTAVPEGNMLAEVTWRRD